MDRDKFIERSKAKFGDRFTYDKVQYHSVFTPVIITCREHGDFSQKPASHWAGSGGCPVCSSKINNFDNFMVKAHHLYGDKYTYSEESYQSQTTKMVITCTIHNHTFAQSPTRHLGGFEGCSRCQGFVVDLDSLKEKSKALGFKWEYPRSEYKDTRTPITVTCPDHGDFSQTPHDLLSGRVACSKCQPSGTSRGEEELFMFLKEAIEGEIIRSIRIGKIMG